jgi:hypothetical protein
MACGSTRGKAKYEFGVEGKIADIAGHSNAGYGFAG